MCQCCLKAENVRGNKTRIRNPRIISMVWQIVDGDFSSDGTCNVSNVSSVSQLTGAAVRCWSLQFPWHQSKATGV